MNLSSMSVTFRESQVTHSCNSAVSGTLLIQMFTIRAVEVYVVDNRRPSIASR